MKLHYFREFLFVLLFWFWFLAPVRLLGLQEPPAKTGKVRDDLKAPWSPCLSFPSRPLSREIWKPEVNYIAGVSIARGGVSVKVGGI